MERKIDNIYIYLWEEFNTIYVGRTINPKGRHYAHKHRKSERTYQFSSEHHVEHPKMIIIENDLNIEEGVEREKYWINYYRENSSYSVLNKSCGGQKGKCTSNLTEEEKKERQREYYQKNKDKIIKYNKKYAEEHKEEIKKREKERYQEYRKEYGRKYREKHKEKLLAKQKKYREKHREELLAKKKKYREENREKILEQKRRYRETHKEELRLKAREYQKMIRESKKIS